MNTFKNIFTLIIDELAKHPAYADRQHACTVAHWLVEYATKKSNAYWITHSQELLTEGQKDTLMLWVHKLTAEQYPLQYILGSVPFGPLTIKVCPPTLIPRPETEQWCIDLISSLHTLGLKNEKLTILDMCAGSGCIGLLLARELTQAHVYAVDISETALTLAKKNAECNNIKNITFIQSNLFNALDKAIHFDFIVSNPPYIDLEEWKTLDQCVTNWEDPQALIAENNGLAIIEQIIKTAPQFLKKDTSLQNVDLPRLIIEIGHAQGPAVQKLFADVQFNNVEIIKDNAGKDRIVQGA